MKTHHWGVSETIARRTDCFVDRFSGRAGGQSSLHRHLHLHNTFIVSAGTIEVRRGPHENDRVHLSAGESITIPAGEPHRLVFATDAHGIEVYTAAKPGGVADPLDIVRHDEGQAPPDLS